MHIEKLKDKYGGKLRYIFVKYVNKELELEDKPILLAMGDYKAQQTLLNQGYIGIALHEKDNDWFVEFRKLK